MNEVLLKIARQEKEGDDSHEGFRHRLEEEYAHREDLIFKYRYAHAAHPLHAFPVFYENAFLFNLANRIIFCGPKSAEAASIVGATAVSTWEDAWRLACQTVGSKEPKVIVTPNVGARMPLLWRAQA